VVLLPTPPIILKSISEHGPPFTWPRGIDIIDTAIIAQPYSTTHLLISLRSVVDLVSRKSIFGYAAPIVCPKGVEYDPIMMLEDEISILP
jgi:hypothetical protein